jgi:hypothetical protein
MAGNFQQMGGGNPMMMQQSQQQHQQQQQQQQQQQGQFPQQASIQQLLLQHLQSHPVQALQGWQASTQVTERLGQVWMM